jgi:CRISPR/Cas system-associated exonuclease Cas4 (RecB family)
MYVSTNDALGGGEKSRFIQQIEFELAQYNPGIEIRNKVVGFSESPVDTLSDQVPKDAAMVERTKNYLATTGLYPTHLNDLIRCSMKFYLGRIVGVKEKEEIEEELGMDKIGTWLHTSLERIDQEYFLQGVDPTEAQSKAILFEEFERLFLGYVTEMGLNSVYYQIGVQQVMEFLRHQIKLSPRRKVVAAEQLLKTDVTVMVDGSPVVVKLGGKIDRVEQGADGTLFVMDYKTGSVELHQETKTTYEERKKKLLSDSTLKAGYARQLWLYKYLVYRQMGESSGLQLADTTYTLADSKVQSGFYSFRAPDKIFENMLEITASVDPHVFIKESEELLQIIIGDLLNKETFFTKTNDLEVCKYCDFKGICGR